MQSARVTIMNKAGLHARAATKLSKLTGSFASSVRIGHEKMVDGKSILSLMMLGAVKGSELTIEVEGEDEEAALAAIVDLINDRFEEAE